MFGSKSTGNGSNAVQTLIGPRDVFSSERIELAAKARVRGNIHYKVVEMAAGAMITGRLIHADTPMAQLTGPEAEA